MIAELAKKARKLVGVLTDRRWRLALWHHRVAAGIEHLGVLRNLGPVGTIVDIGANRGQFALAARCCYPEAQIVSFEPLPGPAAVWRAVFAGDGRAELVEAAVGPESGEAEIHLSARDDSSSLLPITERQSSLFPGTGKAGTATIRVVRLDDVLPSSFEAPALLKLDVQGFELQALVGCEEVLARFDWVYVECSFVELYAGQSFADEVIDWLHDRGMRLAGVYNMACDREGRAVQADFLFNNSSIAHPSQPRRRG